MTETKRPLGVTFVTMTRIMGRSDCLSLIKELEQSSQSELIRDHQLNGEYPTSDYEEIAVFLGRSYHSRFVFRVSHKNLGYSTLTCRFELKPMCGMDPEEDYISDESVYDVKKIMTTNFHRYCRCISESLDSEDWAPTNARHIIPILAEELVS